MIKSEEGRFWKFITSTKYLNETKIKNDEILLKKYFQIKGITMWSLNHHMPKI